MKPNGDMCVYPSCKRFADMIYYDKPICTFCFAKPVDNLHSWLGIADPGCLCDSCTVKTANPKRILASWECADD